MCCIELPTLNFDLSEFPFPSIAVISMLKIFDSDVCYGEYCELEFDAGKEWESICLDDESLDAPIFHIRPYEI